MINKILKAMVEYTKANKGKVLGGIIGFLISILILTIGFLKSLFVISCILVGCFLGERGYHTKDIKIILNRILSLISKN